MTMPAIRFHMVSPDAVKEDSNFARYAFKGFRFASIPCWDGYAALERTHCVATP
jgi:hypothetical protein